MICPMLSRADAPSMRQFARDHSWSAQSNDTGWMSALGPTDDLPPGERSDLAGLPPTYLDAGSAELFRDAIVSFASSLWAKGCRAELHVWSGGFHASDCVDETPIVSAEAHRARREWMRRWLAGDL
nr:MULTISPECIES: alpha/beta hydrolase fold domain-containing protein [Microbacterium]